MLSIRSGASGTIVGGATRNRDNVKKMGYPVFSTGYNCKDVRKRATLDSYNRTISINGVKISPSDLVFADNDGVVVIPAQYEHDVITALINKIAQEQSVASDIAIGDAATDIYVKNGAF